MTVQRRIVPNKSILRQCRAFASTKAELYKVSFNFALKIILNGSNIHSVLFV